MGTRDVVDSFTNVVDEFSQSGHATHQGSLDRMTRLLAPGKDWKVLDVCCGPGIVARQLAAHVESVTGLDLTPAMIERAVAEAKANSVTNAEFKVGNAIPLPFEDGHFDAAVSRFAMHQIPRPADAIAEQMRVVRPGGLVLTFDTLTSEDRREADFHNEVARLREPVHARVLSLTELIRYFDMVGLAIERYESMTYTIGIEDWISQADSPEDSRNQARALFREALGTKKFGGRSVFEEDGAIKYVARWGILVGRKAGGGI